MHDADFAFDKLGGSPLYMFLEMEQKLEKTNILPWCWCLLLFKMSHIFVLCIWAPAGLKCHRKSMPRTSFWTEIKIWQAQRISSLHTPWNGVKITKTNMPRWCCCLLCVKCPTFLCFAFGRLLAWNVTVNPCLAPHDPIKFQKWCDSSILRPFPGFTGPVPFWIQRFVTSTYEKI